MSKKNKKNLFQGREHLKETINSQFLTPPPTVSEVDVSEHKIIKRDLLLILILTLVLFGVLGVITYFDSTDGFLTNLANKVMSFI